MRLSGAYTGADVEFATELGAAVAGTRYFVSDPRVLSVDANGRATAIASGDATVTIVNGPAEYVAPIHVDVPHVPGPAVVGTRGGIVQSTGGLAVAVPPGVLSIDTDVSIVPVAEGDLPQLVPPGFDFVAAFDLELGPEPLTEAVQLAIPAGNEFAPGDRVYFYLAGDYLNDDGTVGPIWWQVDSGVIGTDNVARTNSPPYPGINRRGRYLVVRAGDKIGKLEIKSNLIDEAGEILANEARFTISNNSKIGLANVVVGAFTRISEFVPVSRNGAASSRSGAAVTITSILATMAMETQPEPQQFQIQRLSIDRLPVTTTTNFQVDPDRTNAYTIDVFPAANPLAPNPIITGAQVCFPNQNGCANTDRTEVVLTGSQFITSGQSINDLAVAFTMPGGTSGRRVLVAPHTASTATQLRVEVPDTVTLGLSEITVIRLDEIPTWSQGIVTTRRRPFVSNSITVTPNGTYVFVALPEARLLTTDGCYANPECSYEGQLGVIDGDHEHRYASGHAGDPHFPGDFGRVVARVPVGQSLTNPFPRDVAVTPDNTRAYVTLRGSGGVAVVDTVSLQEIDANGKQPSHNGSTYPIIATNGLAVDPQLFDLQVTDLLEIRGTVDVTSSWVLDLVNIGTGATHRLASGSQKVNSGILARLDPAQYENGSYRLELKEDVSVTPLLKANGDYSVYVYLDAKPRSKSIRLPFGAQPYGIAIDPAGKYAYAAAQNAYNVKGVAASYLFQIDVDPASSTYNRVVRTIPIGASSNLSNIATSSVAPSGLRQIAISEDGLHVYVTAPNNYLDPDFAANQGVLFSSMRGNLIEVDFTPLLSGATSPIVKATRGGRGTYGVAITPGRQDVAYTNSESDAEAVRITISSTNEERIIHFDLDKFKTPRRNQLAVHNARGIAFTQDGKYAFVAGRADRVQTTFGGGFIGTNLIGGGSSSFLDQLANPAFEAGNIAIIKDPLQRDGAEVIAATRPTPYGYPVDLELSDDGRYLYVSFQGLPVCPPDVNGGCKSPTINVNNGHITSVGTEEHGAVFIYDVVEMLSQLEIELAKEPTGLRVVPIDSYPLKDLPKLDPEDSNELQRSVAIPNPKIDVKADSILFDSQVLDQYGTPLVDVNGNPVFEKVFGTPPGSQRAPVATGGFPGGIAVQHGRAPKITLLRPNRSLPGSSRSSTASSQGAFAVEVPEKNIILESQVDVISGVVDRGNGFIDGVSFFL